MISPLRLFFVAERSMAAGVGTYKVHLVKIRIRDSNLRSNGGNTRGKTETSYRLSDDERLELVSLQPSCPGSHTLLCML